jgi:hypothetical protein
MLRFVLLVVFLMALPALIYVALARFRTGQGLDEIMPRLPVVALAAAGAVLTTAVLLVYLQFNRNAPGGQYVPPVFKDGEIQPGHVER